MGSDSIASHATTSTAASNSTRNPVSTSSKAIESDPIEENTQYDFVLYTDGAYFKQKQLGGWGVAIFTVKHTALVSKPSHPPAKTLQTLSGCQLSHSSLEMELIAAIKALEWILMHHPKAYISLVTDAQILLEGLFVKYPNWQANQWRSNNNNPVAFAQLWQRFHQLAHLVDVHFFWTKGHFKNQGNQLADQLARQRILKISTE